VLELIDTGNGYTVRHKGRYVYSRVDPRRDALRRVRRFLALPRIELSGTLVLVPSLGLGYGLSELLEGLGEAARREAGRLHDGIQADDDSAPDDGWHVLCVEADQGLFATALAMRPRVFPEDARLTVVRTDSTQRLAALLRRIGVGRFRRVLVAPLCSGYEIDRSLYDRLASALEDEIRIHWQNRITLVRLGGLWVRNLIANLAVLPKACDWRDLRIEGPVVVAGAGPSLDDALDRIEAWRGRIVLLAVDTAVAPLLRRGLEPDLVLVLDAQMANLLDFVGVDMGRLAIMADLSSTPAILRRAGRLHLYATRFAPLRLFDRLNVAGLLPATIPAVGSVGVTALHAAVELTSGPVLLAGLDFAYAAGRTHARGTPGDSRMSVAADRLHPVESLVSSAIIERRPFRRSGTDCGPVLTDLVLQGYAGQAARIVAAQNRIYSLSGGGLDIGARRSEDLPKAPAALLSTREACRRWSAREVQEFVREENRRILALQQGGGGEAEAAELRAECDYLTVDWPARELPDPATLMSSPRYRRAVASCAALWQRTAGRLTP
jgi:hypothetical protein